ncbi:hypothetical protein BWX42_00420 [Dolosigranulum pigrum]|uniref:Helix-turn-helix transcriptional regulator n=1 Tax=Dolosigranulum pigrum TaxID=29394 RepID=A0A1S8KLG5_9LACT|nr:hypothetical protein BWX42_00420 [Dolosigranulum pigrum]
MNTLGQRIKTIRESVDMNRQTFATYIKVAGGAELVKQWENDEKKPDENTLEQIAVLGRLPPLCWHVGERLTLMR